MESKHSSVPEKNRYEKAYGQAFKIACEQLAQIDIEQQCRQSGAQYQVTDSQKVIILQYLNQPYVITLPHVEISRSGSTEEIPIRDRLLLLHYFLTAKGTPLANRLITFRELPEGSVYYPTFYQRTSQPMVNYFGREPELLLDASEKLGGYRADYGDTAVTINAFNRVPVTIILWRGDDEFAPQASVAFDASISDYLPTEDITVLCETITWKLVKYAREAA